MQEIHEGDVFCWFCNCQLAADARVIRAKFRCPKCGKYTKIPRPKNPETITTGHGFDVKAVAQ